MIPDITATFDAVLGAWADAVSMPVAWDNVPFDPPSDAAYLVSHDMPASPYSIDLAGCCRIHPGVYQINVVVPAGSGRASAKEIASQVAALFPLNQTLSGEGFTAIVISPPAIYSGIQDGVSYTVPVSIRYQAKTVV
jgi:hypothetical protein